MHSEQVSVTSRVVLTVRSLSGSIQGKKVALPAVFMLVTF